MNARSTASGTSRTVGYEVTPCTDDGVRIAPGRPHRRRAPASRFWRSRPPIEPASREAPIDRDRRRDCRNDSHGAGGRETFTGLVLLERPGADRRVEVDAHDARLRVHGDGESRSVGRPPASRWFSGKTSARSQAIVLLGGCCREVRDQERPETQVLQLVGDADPDLRGVRARFLDELGASDDTRLAQRPPVNGEERFVRDVVDIDGGRAVSPTFKDTPQKRSLRVSSDRPSR